MVNISTHCKDCIKEDVCNKKVQFGYIVDRIKETNTTQEDCTFLFAKDNKDIGIDITCKYFMINRVSR